MSGVTLCPLAERLPAAAITVVCLLEAAQPLLATWQHAPTERISGVLFLVWLTAALMAAHHGENKGAMGAVSLPLIGVGAALLAAAQITDLRWLLDLALAVSVAAWIPAETGPRPLRAACIASAAAWMPACGWFVSALLPASGAMALRVLVALAGAAVLRGTRACVASPGSVR